MTIELKPVFDRSKSYFGKAEIKKEGNETILYSYGEKAVGIINSKVKLYYHWDYSQTTLVHTKEFLKQNGFYAETRKQIRSEYGCKYHCYATESIQDNNSVKLIDINDPHLKSNVSNSTDELSQIIK